MKIQFSTIDKIVFAVIAVLAAVVVAIIVLGCDDSAMDADGGEDAASDGGEDAGEPSLPCPFECYTEMMCFSIGGSALGGVECSEPATVCCSSVEM